MRAWMWALLLAVWAGASAAADGSASATVLHSFGPAALDGANPFARLVRGADGNLYGTTFSGGAHNVGTVFRITPTGTLVTIYDFGSAGLDGEYPQAALVEGTDGNFYGTTQGGGTQGRGTVFRLTPGGSLAIVYSFGTFDGDGGSPNELMLASDGNLYGTTFDGGSAEGGTVFRLAGNGAAPTSTPTLRALGTTASEGFGPTAPLVAGADGALYGTTTAGGTGGKGTVFRVTLGGSLSVLHHFDGADGAGPDGALLVGSGGALFYGTTQFGGIDNQGVVYSISAAGSFALLHRFAGGASDGAFPRSGVLAKSDGALIGTTQAGGADNFGTIFLLDPGNGDVTLLYAFGGSADDGINPASGLVAGDDGAWYGSTLNGAANGTGSIFKVAADGGVTQLHAFGAASPVEGATPASVLLELADGTLFGTTQEGGAGGVGTVFKLGPTGSFSVVHAFDASLAQCGNPASGLLLAGDGNLYGTTLNGGQFGAGCVYRVTPTGVFSVVHDFGGVAGEGINPQAALVVGLDGHLYGTTLGGGAHGNGSVFRLTLAGVLTTLHGFDAGVDEGDAPGAVLVQAGNGTLYGTTLAGGAFGQGTLFAITPAGAFETLHSFDPQASLGYAPEAGLIATGDGDFLGTTGSGGARDGGTVFRFTPGQVPQLLHAFGTRADDGRNPATELVDAGDGIFFGLTTAGGTSGRGTVFRVGRDGSVRSIYDFGSAGGAGSTPFAGLAEGRDGAFYGTASSGGASGTGTVYRIAILPPPDSESGGGGGAGSVSPSMLALLLSVALAHRRRILPLRPSSRS